MMTTQRFVTYNVKIEEGPTSFGAQVVELPGCFAVAPTREELMRRIRKAAQLHLRSMIEDGEEIPISVEVSQGVSQEVSQEAFRLA